MKVKWRVYQLSLFFFPLSSSQVNASSHASLWSVISVTCARTFYQAAAGKTSRLSPIACCVVFPMLMEVHCDRCAVVLAVNNADQHGPCGERHCFLLKLYTSYPMRVKLMVRLHVRLSSYWNRNKCKVVSSVFLSKQNPCMPYMTFLHNYIVTLIFFIFLLNSLKCNEESYSKKNKYDAYKSNTRC